MILFTIVFPTPLQIANFLLPPKLARIEDQRYLRIKEGLAQELP
jgi:hypothetical protein